MPFRSLLPLALLCLLCFGSQARAGTLIENVTLQHDDIPRYFDLFIPSEASEPAPLLLVLHGGSGNKDEQRSGPMGVFLALAEAEGFYVALPNGVSTKTQLSGTSPDGDFHWNDCRSDPGVSGTFRDDVGFVSALIDTVAATHPIDLSRVTVVGSSNGGMMALRLALELSERIAAVAALIANLPANSECAASPEFPITVVTLAGTAENFWMPFDGGQILLNRGLVLSAEATRDYFVALAQTDPTPEQSTFADLDPLDGGQVVREIYSGGDEGSRVVFYRVGGAGHIQPSISERVGAAVEGVFGMQNHDIETANEIWQQLRVETLPEPACTAAVALATLVALQRRSSLRSATSLAGPRQR